jgi:hypothetical protein
LTKLSHKDIMVEMPEGGFLSFLLFLCLCHPASNAMGIL